MARSTAAKSSPLPKISPSMEAHLERCMDSRFARFSTWLSKQVVLSLASTTLVVHESRKVLLRSAPMQRFSSAMSVHQVSCHKSASSWAHVRAVRCTVLRSRTLSSWSTKQHTCSSPVQKSSRRLPTRSFPSKISVEQ